MPNFIQEVLDLIFYSSFLKITILVVASMVLIFSIVLVTQQKWKKTSLFYVLFSTLSLGCIYYLLGSQDAREYGYVENFQFCVMHPHSTQFWAFDEIKLNYRGNQRKYYRVHCIDIVSGERLFRKALNNNTELIGLKNDTIWFREVSPENISGKLIYHNIITAYQFPSGKELLTIDDNLLNTVSQLSSKLDKNHSEYLLFDINNYLISVKAIDGYYYYLSPELQVKKTTLTPPNIQPLKLKESYIELEGADRTYLKNPFNGKVFPQKTYIKPAFLLADKQQTRLLFLSYATVVEEKPMIHSTDLEGNLIWTQTINDKPRFFGQHGDLFYIATKDTIYVFGIKKGELIWKKTY
ncbi:MAG: hypothetical protein EAZ55_01195 [Cytophagales bacterium]|nr:MAG: hypothetical protein EAZ55_01195 [Cytophagales bacterium]